MALAEKKLQDAHEDHLDPELCYILVILISTHSPMGIIMQRVGILEWILLAHKQSKKIKTYMENISELILKGKVRIHQLAG